jgi:hypothetical protein
MGGMELNSLKSVYKEDSVKSPNEIVEEDSMSDSSD